MSDLTNAVERIGRAGSEDSRATQKLKDACIKLADYISDDVFDECITIPRERTDNSGRFEQYRVQEDSRGFRYLAMQVGSDGSYGEAFFTTSRNWMRDECLAFSRDVAKGLLDHIAAWLEQRASESESAAIAVDSATPK